MVKKRSYLCDKPNKSGNRDLEFNSGNPGENEAGRVVKQFFHLILTYMSSALLVNHVRLSIME